MDQFKRTIRAAFRKPVGAAALSFLFPGLGQAAAGDRNRGAIVAIPMLAVLGAFALILIFDRSSLFGLAVDQGWLTSLLILDLAAFIYHFWAVVDAYMVANNVQNKRRRGVGHTTQWAAVLGIGLILSGTVAVHGGVAKVDSDWQHALYCLTAKIPCWVTDNNQTFDPNATDNSDSGNGIADPVDTSSPGAGGSGSAKPIPTVDLSSLPSFSTTADSANWNADGELNVLLMGLGVQKGNSASQLGPDTIMVMHVGVNSGQAELISVGRNNYCMPLPTSEIAQKYSTLVNGCPAGTWGHGTWDLPNEILAHCNKWPIPEYAATCGQAGDPNRYLRAYKGTEMTIGYLLGLHIDGSMWINPKGLSTLIDALGGVNITVATKLVDGPCGYAGSANYKLGALSQFSGIGRPSCPDTSHTGYFVPTGLDGVQKMKDLAASTNGGLTVIQVPGHPNDVGFIMRTGTYHMNGEWALAYARTRIYTNDASRSLRQQELLRYIKKDLDPCHFANVANVLPLLGALQAIPQGFNTNMDLTNGANLQAWAGMAKNVLGPNVQELVLTQTGGKGATGQSAVKASGIWWPAWDPNSIAKARNLVKANFVKPSAGAGGSGGSGGTSSC
jgi:anionic cell wall polymer biosynthesis LytR-Cps2A-Psr (LCP) family protein